MPITSAALALVAPYFDHEPEIDSDAGAHFEAMVTLNLETAVDRL